ncbi:MAG: alternative ribosome rescue aminoacyl-tRNA hydrolase ArfB [Chitinophagales bacterium]
MISIDLTPELSFKNVRSSGKGGQHVNKVSTKVELNFDVVNSELLTQAQKQLLLSRLQNRISKEGIFRLTVQDERSAIRNQSIALERFEEIIKEALTLRKKRKRRLPSKAYHANRLKNKKIHSEKKQSRNTNWRKNLD